MRGLAAKSCGLGSILGYSLSGTMRWLVTNQEQLSVSALVTLGTRARFGDYVRCRSGRDEYSKLSLSALEHLVGAPVRDQVDRVPDVDRAKVYRWVLRGLPVAQAIQKCVVDAEVSYNAKQRTRRHRPRRRRRY